jgi:hypothetical protein
VLVAAFTLGAVHALASRFVNAIRSGLIVLGQVPGFGIPAVGVDQFAEVF